MAQTARNISKVNRSSRSDRVVFGEALYNPGGICGPRVQQDFQMVHLIKGELRIELDGKNHRLMPGHWTLLIPGRTEFIQFSTKDPSLHTWCAVHPSLVDPVLAKRLKALPFSLPMTRRGLQLVEMGLSVKPPVSSDAEVLIDHLGLALLQEMVLGGDQAHQGASALPAALTKVQAYVEEHYAEDLSLEKMAKVGCVSAQHLIKLFRMHLGITPARYWWKLRVDRGVQLICETGLTIGEISDRLGFQTPFHFSRLVRNHYGSPPRQIRQDAWKGIRSKKATS